MASLYLIPHWFFGFDIAMELIFAVIALLVAFFAYRIYKVSEHEETKFFAIAFSLISASYIIWAGLNLFLVSNLTDKVMEISLSNLFSINYILTLAYMCLFVLGLLTIAYSQFKIKSGRIYYIFVGLALIAVVSSTFPLITYRLLSIFLLTFIVYHYLAEHSAHKNRKTRLILSAFVLLLLSSIDFIFANYSYCAYVVGHFLELGAYCLILKSLLSSIKK